MHGTKEGFPFDNIFVFCNQDISFYKTSEVGL